MILKIYYSDKDIKIIIKDIYIEEQIIEALEIGQPLALTKEDGNALILNMMNITMIEICNQ